MKHSLSRLIRSIILEQVEDLFVDPSASPETTRLEVDSADDQIDSFILKFEKDSVENDDQDSESMNESFRSLSLKALLEQEEEEDPVEDEVEAEVTEEEPEADTPSDPEPAGSEDQDALPAESVPKMPLNIDAFTKRIARLAMNSEKLLDIKTVIINRAMNFLKDNYDDAHALEMKDILDAQFDFDLDGGKDIPAAPFAAGANASGAGSMGGGG